MGEYREALKAICMSIGQITHLWDRSTYDMFEIGMCEIIGEENGVELIERHDDPERRPVHMYTVYGHLPEGGVEALFDFDTYEEAESVMNELDVLTFEGEPAVRTSKGARPSHTRDGDSVKLLERIIGRKARK